MKSAPLSIRIATKYSASDRRKYWKQNVFRFRAVWVAKWAFGMLGGDGKAESWAPGQGPAGLIGVVL